jgi:hypothetical protein
MFWLKLIAAGIPLAIIALGVLFCIPSRNDDDLGRGMSAGFGLILVLAGFALGGVELLVWLVAWVFRG